MRETDLAEEMLSPDMMLSFSYRKVAVIWGPSAETDVILRLEVRGVSGAKLKMAPFKRIGYSGYSHISGILYLLTNCFEHASGVAYQ